MGFNETMYVVNETDEQVELCVIVISEGQNIGDFNFSLAVETQNGTAGTSKSFEWIKFWMEILHFRTTVSLQLSLLTEYNSLPMVTMDVQHTPLPHTPACTIQWVLTVLDPG